MSLKSQYNSCSQDSTTTGQSESRHAARNGFTTSSTGPHGLNPFKKRLHSAGRISAALSMLTSCKACVMSSPKFYNMYRPCTAINGRKRSNHCRASMLSWSSTWESISPLISRLSTWDRRRECPLHSCAIHKTCWSKPSHLVPKSKLVSDPSVILADQGYSSTWAHLSHLNLSALLMKLYSCGKTGRKSMKNHMLRLSRLGALIQAMRSSKYLVSPQNARYIRVERTVWVDGHECV